MVLSGARWHVHAQRVVPIRERLTGPCAHTAKSRWLRRERGHGVYTIQMCNKQCRDENGFKCHQMSESHLQQMKVFGANPHRVVDGYSDMFLETFVNHLKVAYVP